MLRSLAKRIYRLLWLMRFLLPIDKKKIVIVCFRGRGFSDHPKYIVEALHEVRPDLKVYWAVSDSKYASGLPQYVRPVRIRTLAYVYHMVTARLWIDISRKPIYERKRTGQLYMQVWHTGNACLKKVERHAEDKLSSVYLADAIADAKQIDVMVSGSRFTDECFRDGFWYPEGEILSVGSPRNDVLFASGSEIKNRVHRLLGVDVETNFALYAPTFRNDNSVATYFLDFQGIVDALETRFGGSWKVVLRLHPNVAKESFRLGIEDSVSVIDATHFDDMQELLVACDVLITDYSSSVFDYMLTKRPIFTHATDYEAYVDERGLYFDLRRLPFYFSDSTEQLLTNIRNFEQASFQEDCSQFMLEQGFYDDGDASERVVEWILENA